MILISPLKTEKAIGKIETENSITFVVSPGSTKPEIAAEVEKLFNVKVAKITTSRTMKGTKHAIVTLDKKYKADDIATKLKLVA